MRVVGRSVSARVGDPLDPLGQIQRVAVGIERHCERIVPSVAKSTGRSYALATVSPRDSEGGIAVKSLCRVILVGHLGRDPRLELESPSRVACFFDVAVHEPIRSGDSWESRTQWYHVAVFGALAAWCSEALSKGAYVCVEGRVHVSGLQKQVATYGSVPIYASSVTPLRDVQALTVGDGDDESDLDDEEYDEADADDDEASRLEAEAEHEHDEIVTDLLDDEEDWARSDEDGWFYDDDGEEDGDEDFDGDDNDGERY